MSDFDAIDSLLASLTPHTPLPEAPVRRDLRERAGLSKAQVARALGVSPSTVTGWEAGRDPVGEVRAKYAYLLDGLADKLTHPVPSPANEAPSAPSATPEAPPPEPAPDAGPTSDAETSVRTPGAHPDDGDALAEPQPCVLCGRPAHHQVAGFPQHLDPTQCAPAEPQASRTTTPAPTPPAARRARATSPTGRATPHTGTPSRPRSSPDPIAAAVTDALATHEGDVEAATAALVKRAIPDAMALLDSCRKGGRYAIVAHPWIPDILRKQSARGADQIWEARPKWFRPELPPGVHEVTALDINGAYLSALKTHLPIGQLEHTIGTTHDRRRAGVHLITPPPWEHGAYLPNPIGNRDEPGPLWVTEPTLRLLLRLSGPKLGLCEPPEIHESFTSGATENLLEKFRVILKDARDRAIAQEDEVTLEYVKAMYSKFVSTMGESNYNRELYRPDWMHLIRSQAFANLWTKALKAHDAGLTVVRAMGTDELHVIGDWPKVFPEGRGVSEVKVKDVYPIGSEPTDPAAAGPIDEN
ncbi:helix-turn-helix domain-containing protein [Streptomyces triticirhizae]|uniref:XRE family transcriptional regulator n=1 Tax=Streptomyces triticirhizae TaxID=2483353 RepID=A0A3M2LZC6_9ACTN|nr:helix-turn-helix transcriptional regulator [Streptomyces triticirhizae]RMI42492.1 XRE family transcriptional regulator [Streptomyces triticirhizae]